MKGECDMIGTTDYVIMIGELIEKWCPNLEWDEIMEMAMTGDPIARKAEKEVQEAIKEGRI